jgi:hypothetical protein
MQVWLSRATWRNDHQVHRNAGGPGRILRYTHKVGQLLFGQHFGRWPYDYNFILRHILSPSIFVLVSTKTDERISFSLYTTF